MQETYTNDGLQMLTIVLDPGVLMENGIKGGDQGRWRAGRSLLGGSGDGRVHMSCLKLGGHDRRHSHRSWEMLLAQPRLAPLMISFAKTSTPNG